MVMTILDPVSGEESATRTVMKKEMAGSSYEPAAPFLLRKSSVPLQMFMFMLSEAYCTLSSSLLPEQKVRLTVRLPLSCVFMQFHSYMPIRTRLHPVCPPILF